MLYLLNHLYIFFFVSHIYLCINVREFTAFNNGMCRKHSLQLQGRIK